MLNILSNLLFAMFSYSFPLYKQVYAIIKELRDYSPNAIATVQNYTKTSILWIPLFNQGGSRKEIWCDSTDTLESSPTW